MNAEPTQRKTRRFHPHEYGSNTIKDIALLLRGLDEGETVASLIASFPIKLELIHELLIEHPQILTEQDVYYILWYFTDTKTGHLAEAHPLFSESMYEIDPREGTPEEARRKALTLALFVTQLGTREQADQVHKASSAEGLL